MEFDRIEKILNLYKYKHLQKILQNEYSQIEKIIRSYEGKKLQEILTQIIHKYNCELNLNYDFTGL